MHELHDYIGKQLFDQLKKRSVVVFYDSREEFRGFIDELPVVTKDGAVEQVEIQSVPIRLARFRGSFFGLRVAVETFIAVDQPEPLLLYVPGVTRDRKGSLLMEIEKAGSSWEPQLKRLARNVLSKRYTEGVIDGMLAAEAITYRDLVAMLEQTGDGEPPSILKVIFGGISDGIALLAAWLADASKDDPLQEKEAVGELYSPLHPAVLQLLAQVIGTARAHATPLSVCGEIAGDPRMTPLLLALGLTEFSLHPATLLEVRRAIRDCNHGELRARAGKLLQARDRRGIERWLAGTCPP